MNNKGITLIALVITIIVMLILVAVTILMAVNGGLFGYAGKATVDTKKALEEEKNLGSVEEGLSTDQLIEKYAIMEISAGKILTKNETITQTDTETGKTYKAIIPKGFGIVRGCETIIDGLVISDEFDSSGNSIGNEFVWIPVIVTGETQAEKEENFDKIRTTYGDSNRVEPYSEEGYTDDVIEYNKMRASVIANEGFYIGRYEAGIPTTEEPRPNVHTETIRTNVGTNTMVVKRDCYPYNDVYYGNTRTDLSSDIIIHESGGTFNMGHGEVYLSRNMYPENNNNYGVVSTLSYGVQWDAMVKWVGKEEETDSTTWGNYYTNTGDTWKITRQSARYTADLGKTWHLISEEENHQKEKTGYAGILLTTGANDRFKIKNLYDIAGNCAESTMDLARRGSYFGYNGDGYTRSVNSKGELPDTLGTAFRPALYIKSST